VGQRDLPTKIEFENNKRIYYLYDAAGTKLRKYYYEDSRLIGRLADWTIGRLVDWTIGRLAEVSMLTGIWDLEILR